MAFPKNTQELCGPALLYFGLSVIAILLSVFQNMGQTNRYLLGGMSTKVQSTVLVFIAKIVYILFWTWILNLICKDGHGGIAWFLVLVPFIMMAVIVALSMEALAHPVKVVRVQPNNRRRNSGMN